MAGAGHDNSLRHVSFIPPNKYYSDSNTAKDKKNTQHKKKLSDHNVKFEERVLLIVVGRMRLPGQNLVLIFF